MFVNDACHRHDRPLTRPAVSSREGPIEQPKSSLYKLVQLRFSCCHRARCFLGDLRQHWCILREYVMGFFPDSPRIRKQVWVPGMCFAQLAHLDSAKELWRLHLCLISEGNISCLTWKVLRCLCEIYGEESLHTPKNSGSLLGWLQFSWLVFLFIVWHFITRDKNHQNLKVGTESIKG